MVICLERDAHLHMAQLMPVPLTVSCFSKIQIGFTFLVPADLGSPRQRAVKRVCVWSKLLPGRKSFYVTKPGYVYVVVAFSISLLCACLLVSCLCK